MDLEVGLGDNSITIIKSKSNQKHVNKNRIAKLVTKHSPKLYLDPFQSKDYNKHCSGCLLKHKTVHMILLYQ